MKKDISRDPLKEGFKKTYFSTNNVCSFKAQRGATQVHKMYTRENLILVQAQDLERLVHALLELRLITHEVSHKSLLIRQSPPPLSLGR